MHRKLFGSTKRRVVALFALLALFGGGGAVVAGIASASAPRGTCVKVGTGEYRDLWLNPDGTCPTGFWGPKVFGGGLSAADVQTLVNAAVAKAVANLPAVPAGLSPKKDQVTFDADWASNASIKKVNTAPTGPNAAGYLTLPAANIGVSTETAAGTPGRYYFVVTQTGISAYSTSTRELFGSNVASSTMASESDVQVEGVIQPAPGSTTRSFVVSIATNSADDLANAKLAAFANSRHFTLQFFTYI